MELLLVGVKVLERESSIIRSACVLTTVVYALNTDKCLMYVPYSYHHYQWLDDHSFLILHIWTSHKI